MNEKTPHPIPQSPSFQSPITNLQSPKAEWSEPVLRVTPIAETASSKATAIGDGFDAFSS